jgi:cell division protein ZipA
MNELRWILLAAGALALLLIYLHGRRKRLATADQRMTREAELPQLNESASVRRREPAISISSQASRIVIDDLPEVHAHATPDDAAPFTEQEALSTAALDRLTITQPLNPREEPSAIAQAPVPDDRASIRRPPASATAPRTARKIVALRVPALTQAFNGGRLREIFSEQGLRHGRYGIYHRPDAQGVPIYSVASIVEPGTFDPAAMLNQEFLGVSLFLQLPGPLDGVTAFDAMLECAQTLQTAFNAGLQGERGKELTAETVARLREEIADFQHLLRQPSAGT